MAVSQAILNAHEQYSISVKESASAAIDKAEHLQRLGQEYVDQAQECLVMLVEGPIDASRIARMHSTSVRAAERRFAGACWNKRNKAVGLTLPGMFNPHYGVDYSDARRRSEKG